jgi:aspartate aminotransferase
LIAKNSTVADIIYAAIQRVVRVNYSMPPAHGAAVVETILGSDELTSQWHGELEVMRERISQMRQVLVSSLAAKGVKQDFSFITRQNGMFSFLGINGEQVQRLQDEFSIYIVGSSRINLAGISPDNIDYLSESIAKVL